MVVDCVRLHVERRKQKQKQQHWNQVVEQVPGEGRRPEHGPVPAAHKLHVLCLARPLGDQENWNKHQEGSWRNLTCSRSARGACMTQTRPSVCDNGGRNAADSRSETKSHALWIVPMTGQPPPDPSLTHKAAREERHSEHHVERDAEAVEVEVYFVVNLHAECADFSKGD